MADYKAVTTGTSSESNAFTFQTDTVAAMLQVKADHTGTPAANDDIAFRVLGTTGDPDGSSSDEYDDAVNAPIECYVELDLQDPAIRCFQLPVPLKGMKLRATNSGASTVNVSGRVLEIGADGAQTSTLLAWT